MPRQSEYARLRTGLGLWDGAMLGLLRVTGTDRAAFLHNLLTNEMTRLMPGQGCRAGLVTPSAKLLADLVVLADGEAHWLLSDASRLEVIVSTCEHYRIMEDVRVEDVSRQTVILGLMGEGAPTTAARLWPRAALDRPYAHAQVRIEEVPAQAIRADWLGVAGIMLTAPAEQAAWLWEALLKTGAQPVGWEALNIARIEAGCPWYGLDMDETNLLPETGLEQTAVSDAKGCYIGQEVIARMATYGSVSRKLMRLRCDGTTVPARGDEITKDGEPLGAVTSACRSPRLAQPLALGYIKRPHYEAGAHVHIRREKHLISATLD